MEHEDYAGTHTFLGIQ